MKPDLWLTVETRGAFRCVWFPSRGRQRIVWTTMIVRISIERPRLFVEELHDRGAIEPRSRIIRRGITSTIIVWQLLEHQYHDWRAIVARPRRDRGSFLSKIEANSPPNWSGIEATTYAKANSPSIPRSLQIAPTTASTAHDLRANFPFKNPCISSLFFNFWSIHEGIKRISRKISSSSWSPRV